MFLLQDMSIILLTLLFLCRRVFLMVVITYLLTRPITPSTCVFSLRWTFWLVTVTSSEFLIRRSSTIPFRSVLINYDSDPLVGTL